VLDTVPSAGRLRVHDVAADGRMAVTHVSGRMRMMVKAPGAADEVDLALSDVSLVGDISGDGRSVVVTEFGDVDTASGGYVRPTDGGAALRLGDSTPFDLSDDGRGVLVATYSEPRRFAIVPLPDGQPQPLPLPGLADPRWARWCGRDRIVVAAAAAGSKRCRLWRIDPDQRIVPISDEAVTAKAASSPVSPDGRSIAFVTDDRLLAFDIDGNAPPRTVPGTFVDELVCGWSGDSREVFVRSKSPPIQIRRVDVITGAAAFVREVAPPRVGLRGVDAMFVSHSGEAYAYSYGQELSRLYTMTTEDPGG
jgi:hypothetical protein